MPGAASATSSSGGNAGGGTKRKSEQMLTPPHGASNSSGSALTLAGAVGEGGELNGTGGNDGPGGAGQDGRKEKQTESQAVMKMKADVFEKDRDTFLNTFEKPTQIYRFLRARMLESPIFLQRNLSYMRDRMSRSHKSRAEFDWASLKVKKEKVEGRNSSRLSHSSPRGSHGYFQNNGPIKFYNFIVMGLADGQVWHPDTRARIDVCLARVCVNRRKEGSGPVSKIFEKSLDFKVYSPSSPKSTHEITIPYPARCPVVAIPSDVCSLGTNGHTVRSFKLVIRVTIPVKCLQQNLNNNKTDSPTIHLNSRNNSDNCEEPKAKRRRSAPATKDRENFIYGSEGNKTGSGGAGGGMLGQDKSDDYIIYTGHISLYEKDIPGDKIRDVDFDVVLKRTQKAFANKISHQRIRREISYEHLDEKHSKVLEQAKPVGRCAKICLAVRTSSETVPSFVEPPPRVAITAVKNEVGASNEKLSLARLEQNKSVRVIYSFIHGNNNQQQTESRDDLRCPWCSINCMQLYSLMKHLKLSHPRFHFSYSPIPNGAKIDVTINDSFDGSYSGSAFDLVSQPPGEAFARNGPTKRTEVFSILVCRPKAFKQTLQEFFDSDETNVDQRRTYITGHNRLYHHTSTCLPIHPREIDVDSEGEPDPEWLRVKTTMMIDEFTDVNEGEKELMKLWNLHVMKYNYVGDCQIPFACKRFVEFHGKELIQKNLYRNFCLHIVNLYDFGLLTPQGAHQTIQLLHSQMRDNPVMAREVRKPVKPHSYSINGLGLAPISEGPFSAASSSHTFSKSFSTSGAGGTADFLAGTPTPPTSNTASPKTAPSSATKLGTRDASHPGNNTANMSIAGGSASIPLMNGVRKQEPNKVKKPTKESRSLTPK